MHPGLIKSSKTKGRTVNVEHDECRLQGTGYLGEDDEGGEARGGVPDEAGVGGEPGDVALVAAVEEDGPAGARPPAGAGAAHEVPLLEELLLAGEAEVGQPLPKYRVSNSYPPPTPSPTPARGRPAARGPSEKMNTTLRSPRRVGAARGARRARLWQAAATAALGEERGREPEEGMSMGRVRERRGGRVASPGVEEASREAGGGGSRRWPRVRAQATRLCLLARGGRRQGGGGGGLGRSATVLGRLCCR